MRPPCGSFPWRPVAAESSSWPWLRVASTPTAWAPSSRGSPRHSDVMMVAGTITVKMAPRVKKLWDQMPEPKWAIAVGSCAISGDFYRNIYSVVPGIDTFIPVDVYVPGCPPNPEAMMHGLLRLQERIRADREGRVTERDVRPEPLPNQRLPRLPLYNDPTRPELLNRQQISSAAALGWWDELNLDAALDAAARDEESGTESESKEQPTASTPKSERPGEPR
ncbi:MAG: NADH-quinone oxidoreductase subunit NuoB [Polyangiaceae bacterium]